MNTYTGKPIGPCPACDGQGVTLVRAIRRVAVGLETLRLRCGRCRGRGRVVVKERAA